MRGEEKLVLCAGLSSAIGLLLHEKLKILLVEDGTEYCVEGCHCWDISSIIYHTGIISVLLIASLLIESLRTTTCTSTTFRKGILGIGYCMVIPFIIFALNILENASDCEGLYSQLALVEICSFLTVVWGYTLMNGSTLLGFFTLLIIPSSFLFVDISIDLPLKLLINILGLIFLVALMNLTRLFPHTFSFGEATITLQACAILLLQTATFSKSSYGQPEDPGSSLLGVMYSSGALICVVCSLSVIGCMLVCHYFKLTTHTMIAGVMGCVTVAGLTLYHRGQLVHLVIDITTDYQSTLLLIYWLVISMAALALVGYCNLHDIAVTSEVRKYFHVAAVLIFLPGIYLNLHMTKLASSAAFSLFIVVEVMRFVKFPLIGEILDDSLSRFTDEQDSGCLILTHIYLLVGCSLPLWLAPQRDLDGLHLSLIAGVTSLGVGDSFASVVGSRHGRHKYKAFSGSSKSVEGTLAAFTSMVLFCAGILVAGDFEFSILDLVLVTINCLFLSLLEAFTIQVDNLVLPLYFYLLMLPLFR